MTQSYPLHWPEGWGKTVNPSTSRFYTSLSKAMDNVERALKQFSSDSGKGIQNIIISTNYSLSDRNPKEAGVAVYFSWDGLQSCIAVDRYKKIEDNLQAIYHCLEAERTKLRHGGINLVRAAFRGYAALPPPSGTSNQKKHWTALLNVASSASLDEIKTAYRAAARKAHPDNGGSNEKMAEINAAYNEAIVGK